MRTLSSPRRHWLPLIAALAAAAGANPVQASSHREAPFITTAPATWR